jgi:hypothetical protein
VDDHVLGLCVRRLVHPRPFATAARASKRLLGVVAVVREELEKQVCKEHRLESARGEAAGHMLIERIDRMKWSTSSRCPCLLQAEAFRLMVAGAPLDVQDADGDTALIAAASMNYAEIALALIGAGAPLDVQNERGDTALMLAVDEGHTEIVAAQDQRGETALMKAVNGRTTGILQMLIKAGANLDLQDQHGQTALMWAAYGHTEFVKALIKAGAKLYLMDDWGCDALRHAKNARCDAARCGRSSAAIHETERVLTIACQQLEDAYTSDDYYTSLDVLDTLTVRN